MTKHIYKSVLLLSLLLFVARASAAPCEAEYGKVSKAWILNTDGSQEYHYSMELTLFTHTAMNSTYGESFVVYNPNFQEVKVNTSYTKQKDGTIIKTPENAFVEVLPRYATDAVAYNQLKELVIVHTGLELGATIYLDYTVRTKAGYYPALDVCEYLQESSPVKEYKASITTPENVPLAFHYQLYASPVKGMETKQGDTKTVSWTLRNVEASSRENFTPQNQNNVPRLVANSFASQSEALGWISKQFSEAKAMEPETYAEHITEKANTPTEKLEIIRKYVANGLGTSQVPLTDTGYKIRNGEEVVRSAYGTVAEKTQLLNAMLNEVGVSSCIVVSYPATLDAGVCGLKAIKRYLVKATVEGKDRYLSATSTTDVNLSARGALDKVFTLDGKEITTTMAPLIVNEQKAVKITADKAMNGFVICTLPAITDGVDGWSMSTLNSKRDGLFETPSCVNEKVVYTVMAENGLTLKTNVGTKTINKSCGSFTQSIILKDGVVEVTRSIELKKMQFSPAEYADFRALMVAWTNPTDRVLLFSAAK